MSGDTIVLVTSNSVYRVDRVGTATPSLGASLPRSPGETLAESVGMLLRSSRQRLGRVWIAATDAWVGDIEMERRVLHAVGEEGMEEALAIEAEGISGIPAFSSRLAIVPQTIAAVTLKSSARVTSPALDGPPNLIPPPSANTANFLVLQLDEHEFAAIEAEVNDRQGKLMGIGSAAILALPRAGSQPGLDSPRLIACELESGTVVASRFGETTVAWMLPGRFDLSQLQREYGPSLGEPFDPAGIHAFLATPLENAVSPDPSSERIQSWEDPAAILPWASLWFDGVHQAASESLVIAPIKAPVSNRVWTSLAFAAAAITTIACLGWQYQAGHEVERLFAESEILRQEKARPSQLQKNIAALEKELRSVTDGNASLEQQVVSAQYSSRWVSARLQVRQTRWQALIDAIATSVGDQCVIESLVWTAQELNIEGHCLTAADAHRTADRLARQIVSVGWQVDPAQTEFGDNQLYSFRLSARPSHPATLDDEEADFVSNDQLEIRAGRRLVSDRAAGASEP